MEGAPFIGNCQGGECAWGRAPPALAVLGEQLHEGRGRGRARERARQAARSALAQRHARRRGRALLPGGRKRAAAIHHIGRVGRRDVEPAQWLACHPMPVAPHPPQVAKIAGYSAGRTQHTTGLSAFPSSQSAQRQNTQATEYTGGHRTRELHCENLFVCNCIC